MAAQTPAPKVAPVPAPVEAPTPVPAPQPIVVSAQEYKHQQMVKAMAEAVAKQLDYAPNGGRYRRGDQIVDADGNVIKGDN